MRFGDGLRFMAALLLLGLVGIIAVGAFGAGYWAGSAEGAPHVSTWAHDGGFDGGHLLGFLVAIVVLIVIVRLIMLATFGQRDYGWSHHGHWHGGHGHWRGSHGPGRCGCGYGRGGWYRGDWQDAEQAECDDFHDRAHGAEPPSADGGPAKPGTR